MTLAVEARAFYNEDVSVDRLTRNDVMTAREVSAMLRCSPRTVYDLARRDELPGARHLGRTLIVVRPVLESWPLTGRAPDSSSGS